MTFEPKELIISKPEFMRTNQKVGAFLTFMLFWTVFLLLIRPLITLLGWLFAAYILKKNMFGIDNIYDLFIAPLLPYSIIIAVTLAVLPLWMTYNRIRFRGRRDRRAQAPHKTLGAKIIDDMNISLDDYKTAINGNAIIVNFDEAAHIISVSRWEESQ